MKYLVTLVFSDHFSINVVEDSSHYFDSLNDAIEFIKSSFTKGQVRPDSARIYEVRSCLTCKFLDNKILIS